MITTNIHTSQELHAFLHPSKVYKNLGKLNRRIAHSLSKIILGMSDFLIKKEFYKTEAQIVVSKNKLKITCKFSNKHRTYLFWLILSPDLRDPVGLISYLHSYWFKDHESHTVKNTSLENSKLDPITSNLVELVDGFLVGGRSKNTENLVICTAKIADPEIQKDIHKKYGSMWYVTQDERLFQRPISTVGGFVYQVY